MWLIVLVRLWPVWLMLGLLVGGVWAYQKSKRSGRTSVSPMRTYIGVAVLTLVVGVQQYVDRTIGQPSEVNEKINKWLSDSRYRNYRSRCPDVVLLSEGAGASATLVVSGTVHSAEQLALVKEYVENTHVEFHEKGYPVVSHRFGSDGPKLIVRYDLKKDY